MIWKNRMTHRNYLWALAAFLFSGFLAGCTPLQPHSIQAMRVYDSPELLDNQPQIQRGQPRKVIDTVGWIVGIPGKIVLWNRRVENHHIGPETERAIAEYLDVNNLDTVRVRLNQYRPGEDWHRLVRNKSVGAGWRYTFGAISVLGETVIPGRIFGGDHYNPFTNTIHVYSDIPAIALHEGGHSKDFARRKWKGSYAALYTLPIIPLYHESVASRDVRAYLESLGTLQQREEACQILYPAYGTYVGSAAGNVLPATPVYVASVLGGHLMGWRESASIRHRSQVPSMELTKEPYYLLPSNRIAPKTNCDQPAASQEVQLTHSTQ
jgi:hypothetical protein